MLSLLKNFKRFSIFILAAHLIFLFFPTFVNWNSQYQIGGDTTGYSIIDLLFNGIAVFPIIIFIATIILSIFFALKKKDFLCSICMVWNFINLFIIRHSYNKIMYPVGSVKFIYWYYIIFDLILIFNFVVSALNNGEG